MILFCTRCGSTMHVAIPPGDSLPRNICEACGHIHYENPRMVVGCIAEWDHRILLCRRAIEPRLGYWTLPAGFMENGETTAQAARRETMEEAGAAVTTDALFCMVSLAHFNQVHLFYRGKLLTPDTDAGEESLEVHFFTEAEIPWTQLAFHSVRDALSRYLADRRRGAFGFHELELSLSDFQRPIGSSAAD